jgi:hypothetical protein
VITLNPFQAPRLHEIEAGRKFWGYLDTEALQSRYVLAAYFLRKSRHIVEIGGYRDNLITKFLRGQHQSVSVYSLDAEFEPLELESLNGSPCRVRHVKDHFQNHPYETEGLGVIALGLEIHGDFTPFCELVRAAEIAVLEIPVDHEPSVRCLEDLRSRVPLRVRCQINLDLSPNEALLQEQLQTNMNKPFWRRWLYVLESGV